jgi:hypothetical protein
MEITLAVAADEVDVSRVRPVCHHEDAPGVSAIWSIGKLELRRIDIDVRQVDRLAQPKSCHRARKLRRIPEL